MKNNPRRKARQSRPYSLINRDLPRNDITAAVHSALYVRFSSEDKAVECVAIRTGELQIVRYSDVYGATINSWSSLDKESPRSIVMEAMLADGSTLATTKAFFKLQSVPGVPDEVWKPLTEEVVNKAITKVDGAVKCFVRRVEAETYKVRCAKGHDHEVRFRLNVNDDIKAACIGCPTNLGPYVCHHVTVALALMLGYTTLKNGSTQVLRRAA